MKLARSRPRLRPVRMAMLLTVFAIVALLVPTVAMAAPARVATESASQHSGCAAYHTVRPGDTLSQIAKWYGVSMQAIMNANGIVNPSRILVGQQLCIPGGGSAPPPQPQPPSGCWQWYTVRAGDTLTKIAGWYGTTVQYIMQINGLTTTTIWVGQQLKVPVACNPQPVPPPQPCQCPPPPPPPCNCPPPQPTPPPQPQPTGAWVGQYFNNPTLSGSPVFGSNTDQIAFNWGQNPPAPGLPADFWSARFTQSPWLDAGTYRFNATADDGVRVWVNNQLVIDGWRVQAATSYFGDIALGSGNANIVVEYFEDTGDAVLYVNFTRLQ